MEKKHTSEYIKKYRDSAAEQLIAITDHKERRGIHEELKKVASFQNIKDEREQSRQAPEDGPVSPIESIFADLGPVEKSMEGADYVFLTTYRDVPIKVKYNAAGDKFVKFGMNMHAAAIKQGQKFEKISGAGVPLPLLSLEVNGQVADFKDDPRLEKISEAVFLKYMESNAAGNAAVADMEKARDSHENALDVTARKEKTVGALFKE